MLCKYFASLREVHSRTESTIIIAMTQILQTYPSNSIPFKETHAMTLKFRTQFSPKKSAPAPKPHNSRAPWFAFDHPTLGRVARQSRAIRPGSLEKLVGSANGYQTYQEALKA